ncbi:DUF4365 domain-containing protein [Streptomyces triticirhizae]|uniref:DUF4365 domain-containing protein n=2 Tax=Streptomyces triticirhizae TaxID=2483353 RepID=A0A3M2M9W5_9ACTN|nr:DUF4365 domain-containing protein [Streptomyces triticirhizae]
MGLGRWMALNRDVRQGRYGEIFVRAISTAAGLTVQKIEEDDHMVDLHIGHPGPRGSLLNPKIDVQVKSSRRVRSTSTHVSYGLKSKYYNVFAEPADRFSLPIFLVVVVVPEVADDWMGVTEEQLTLRRAAYWTCLHGQPLRRELDKDTEVKVSVPRENLLTKDALLRMFDVAEDLRMQGRGVPVQ